MSLDDGEGLPAESNTDDAAGHNVGDKHTTAAVMDADSGNAETGDNVAAGGAMVDEYMDVRDEADATPAKKTTTKASSQGNNGATLLELV